MGIFPKVTMQVIVQESEPRKSDSRAHALDPYANSGGQGMLTSSVSGCFIGKATKAKRKVK